MKPLFCGTRSYFATPCSPPGTGHNDDVWEIAFSPNGKTLASASWDGTIILWDVATKQPSGLILGWA